MTGLRALADAQTETMIYTRVLALLELAEAHLDIDDAHAARLHLERAELLIDTEDLQGGGRLWLARVGTRVGLAVGSIDLARTWAEQVDDPFWGGVSTARVLLATADRAAGLAALDAATPRCARHQVVLGLMRAGAVDDQDEALQHASAAVEVAAANEMLQTVASEGSGVLDLIERTAWHAPGPWFDRLRRAVAGGAARPSPGGHELLEQLTDRERDVLRFLPSRLTIKEIAAELYVSINTLKFHLKVIYRKLGVTSRAEAAQRARQLMSG